MFCKNNCKQNQIHRAKNKNKYIEKNNYLLCMHAVFMGMTTASPNGGGGDALLQSDGV